ncbi:uncharacterized protein LOC118436544 [Folsomia candida]|uniref:uncharacterized protein LOC118436544 n=1 Tax=Folsomia candida TaxID=158441 RepID=UPI001604F497|nr:uncharacterized protein LOC118436544 [Folsomia candida]XP_035710763.1 uncharacterized protein LOC118436544 [Folsomia candida]
MFPQKNVCRVFRNKFRHPRARSLFLVIIIVSTFIILISQNKLPSDLDRFQQSDHFATTKDGLILPSLPLSKLSDKIIPTATQLGDELEDCFIRFEKRIMRPHITDLEFHNKLWQVTRLTENNRIYLNGAYIDTRLDGEPLVRILFLTDDIITPPSLVNDFFCRFWINIGNKSYASLAPSEEFTYLWNTNWGKWGAIQPYLLTCKIPPLPKHAESYWESVSLLTGKCSMARNDLRLTYQLPPEDRKTFGLCVKGLNFPSKDISRKLVQWVEMLRILGVDGIHFHVFQVDPATEKVLNHYQANGLATVRPVTIAGEMDSNSTTEYLEKNIAQAWKQELIAYNECFLSNMYKYRYIALLDVDEIILPKLSEDWYGLIEDLYDGDAPSWENSPSFCFQMRLFIDKIVDGFHGGQEIRLVKEEPEDVDEDNNIIPFMMTRINWIVKPEVYTDHSSSYFNSKCIHSTQTALVVNNHAPKMCLSPVKGMTSDNCILHVDPELGYTHHHRESCCEQAHLPHQQEFLRKLFKRDRTILRYMKKLSKNSNKVWNSIFQS